MRNVISKEGIEAILKEMSAITELEELTERLLFVSKVEQGIADANQGRVLEHDEVEKELFSP